jgi:hypothetical protein
LPTPNQGESEQAFVSRCIPIVLRDGTAKDQKQAAAVCYSMFRHENIHSDFERIIGLFFTRYKASEAIQKFSSFIFKNGLNLAKAYNPKVQFQESFEWIEPLIRPYKEDTEAKYYLVTALTADISMNNVDYGPEDRLAREDSSMNWRPVNINHDHSKWLPYPRTRVDFSAANEFSLEATLRVDNQDAWLQKMLDNGEIVHPSIEGRPHPISGRYHFTGLALLEKGVELPGSPLSEIVPLVFNESVGKSICEFKGGKMVCECSLQEAVKVGGYEPPEGGDLPQGGKDILARAYASCRSNHPDYPQEQCSKIAWGAVHNAGYTKDANGTWRKENISEVKNSLKETVKEAFGDASFPDSCFAYVPASAKGENGNKSDRKLPYKNADGSISMDHVRNALARLDQTDGIPAGEKDRIRNMLQNILKRENPDYQPEKLKEQEVPPATNEPNTTPKGDTAECPPNYHMDNGKCVPDVQEQCEAGWHFDAALEKCIPDNPQVNESKLRLKTADLELENIRITEENTELKEENQNLKTQMKRKEADHTQRIEKLTQQNYTKDGVISEANKRIDSLEAKDKRNVEQLQDLSKREQNALQRLEETIKSRDSYKEMHASERKSREETFAENERLSKENLNLTNQLTEAKAREIQWTKEKQNLQEGLAKALKHQKYVYEFLKSKGFELVTTT